MTGGSEDGAPVATYIQLGEFTFLRELYGSSENTCPQFSLADLTSACVSIVLEAPDPVYRVICRARSDLAQRARGDHRFQTHLWSAQFAQLRDVQRSAVNRSPHPKFDLGDLTSACIAIVMARPECEQQILRVARANLAARNGGPMDPPPLRQ